MREVPPILKEWSARLNAQLIRIAAYLQGKTDHYSLKRKKFLLGAFSLVFFTESVVVTVQSFRQKTPIPFRVDRIETIPIQKEDLKNALINEREFHKVREFKNRMDSMAKTQEGRKFFDSLMRLRPHLMDSVDLLIQLYIEQSKTMVK